MQAHGGAIHSSPFSLFVSSFAQKGEAFKGPQLNDCPRAAGDLVGPRLLPEGDVPRALEGGEAAGSEQAVRAMTVRPAEEERGLDGRRAE